MPPSRLGLPQATSSRSPARRRSFPSSACNRLVPDGIRCERDWRCFKLAGPIPFSSIGVLASLVQPLAEAGISVFAISHLRHGLPAGESGGLAPNHRRTAAERTCRGLKFQCRIFSQIRLRNFFRLPGDIHGISKLFLLKQADMGTGHGPDGTERPEDFEVNFALFKLQRRSSSRLHLHVQLRRCLRKVEHEGRT